MYFPDENVADLVSKQPELKDLQFECREGADGESWLVLVTQEVLPREELILSARRVMESVARRFFGEYDGWEAEV